MSKVFIFAMAACVVTGGCQPRRGGDGDGGGGDQLSQREAGAAGDALGNGIEDAAATYGPMTVSGADSTCTTLAGDTTDPDGDAIPNDARLSYDCTTQALGYTGTLTGEQQIVDDRPAAAAWAFTGTADMHASLTGPGGATLTSDWMGDLVGSQTTVLGPFALDRRLDVVTVFETRRLDNGGAGMTTTVVEDNDWTVTFTPQAMWVVGQIVVTGSLDVVGSWSVSVDEQSFDATLSTPTPLTLDPACATLITGGTVTGTYPIAGGTGTVTVTWTGCGQRAVTQES